MPKVARVQKQAINKLIDMAAKMPAKEPSDFALKDAIKELIPTIKNLQSKGYSLAEISQLLSENDVPISMSTLKQYLAEFSKSKSYKKNSSNSDKEEKTKSQKQSKPTVFNQEQEQQQEQDKPKPTSKPITPSNPKDVESAEKDGSNAYKSPPKPGSEEFK